MTAEVELPAVGDWWAVRAESELGRLRLQVEMRQYALELRRDVVAEARWLCFEGVRDLQAIAPPALQAKHRLGRLAIAIDGVLRRIGVRLEATPLRTATDLVQRVQAVNGAGVELGPIQVVEGGFVLIDLVDADYYIQASSVGWCTPEVAGDQGP